MCPRKRPRFLSLAKDTFSILMTFANPTWTNRLFGNSENPILEVVFSFSTRNPTFTIDYYQDPDTRSIEGKREKGRTRVGVRLGVLRLNMSDDIVK